MNRRGIAIRLVLLAVFLPSTALVAGGILGNDEATDATLNRVDNAESLGDRIGEEVAPDYEGGWTVVATQGADQKGYSAELMAVDGDGRLRYHNGTHDVYFDVDPHPTGARDVFYVASTDRESSTMNHLVVANLSTGETRTLYSAPTPNVKHSRWHDADRINATHYVVAGMEADRVFIVDVTTDEIVWQWNANQSFPPSSGGPADDWTHLNDVEVLEDGRIMVSLRNQDQVVFLHRNGTVDADWTLGADDAHRVLWEQHQPDYIPASEGGPAVVVADSVNDRLVEYQRVDGEWERTWVWADSRLRWPRDADRLPDGDTLITDSLGDRVAEIDERGRVTWSVDIGIPYEAERLGTGDESEGGPSARSAELVSRTEDQQRTTLLTLLPPKIHNALIWVVPAGLAPSTAVGVVGYALALAGFVGVDVVPRLLS